jgi:predicted  nucleic acid-binding Zn-ribbon protein
MPPPPPGDPMFRSLDKTGPLEKAVRNAKQGGSGWVLPAVLFTCIALLLGYCIFLNVQLSRTKDATDLLNRDLDNADNRISQLEEELYKTENKLVQQIDATSKELSSVQAHQENEVENIKAAVNQKADKDALASVDRKAQSIQSDVGQIKQNVDAVDSSVKQVDTKVVDLDKRVDEQAKTIEEQRKMLEQSIHNINATREILDSTRETLFNLKTSLDRDYFVFQLHKKSGIIRVKDVGLRLKKTRKKDQRYDVEIFYDDKKMSKDKVAANEPIYFLKLGYKKPYEMVVTQVLDDKVNGYISVPKVAE